MTKKDILEVRKEVHRLQNEAAKNPEHPINNGLKAHFEERNRKLAEIKKSQSNSFLSRSSVKYSLISAVFFLYWLHSPFS